MAARKSYGQSHQVSIQRSAARHPNSFTIINTQRASDTAVSVSQLVGSSGGVRVRVRQRCSAAVIGISTTAAFELCSGVAQDGQLAFSAGRVDGFFLGSVEALSFDDDARSSCQARPRSQKGPGHRLPKQSRSVPCQ
jgi:hypothetical protein